MNSSAHTPLTTSKPKDSAMKLQTRVVKKAKQNLYRRCLVLWVLIIPSAYNHVRTSFNINPGMEAHVIPVGPGVPSCLPLSPKAGFTAPLQLGQTSLRSTPLPALRAHSSHQLRLLPCPVRHGLSVPVETLSAQQQDSHTPFPRLTPYGKLSSPPAEVSGFVTEKIMEM